MKLIFVRHGEPDYTIDSLTEKGRKEAELLSDRMERIDREEQIREIYVSPLGRAQETAAPSLKRLHRNAVTLDWLEEFPPRILRPDSSGERKITWDWLPEDWTARSCFYDPDRWGEDPVMREAHVKERYDSVCSSFDRLLASHGYVRENQMYRAEQANRDTLVFFCHLGVECVLVSHLLHMSPMQLWQGFCLQTSSVTRICTEERRKGKACFRVLYFGDISHLYAAGEQPSFAARFCECFDDAEQFGERTDN